MLKLAHFLVAVIVLTAALSPAFYAYAALA